MGAFKHGCRKGQLVTAMLKEMGSLDEAVEVSVACGPGISS